MNLDRETLETLSPPPVWERLEWRAASMNETFRSHENERASLRKWVKAVMVHRPCVVCGEQLPSGKKRRKTCSPECFKKHRLAYLTKKNHERRSR